MTISVLRPVQRTVNLRLSTPSKSSRDHLDPEPLKVAETAQTIRGQSPDETFDNSTRIARSALRWPGKRDGFPILLVASDINCAKWTISIESRAHRWRAGLRWQHRQ